MSRRPPKRRKSRRTRRSRFIGKTVRALADHMAHEKKVVKRLIAVLLGDEEAVKQVAEEYGVSESRARDAIAKIAKGDLG